jgi:hypothetical protein
MGDAAGATRRSTRTVGTTSPVFIAGAGRSGKTLMRWILSSHPRIVVTRRTDLWPRFFDRFGDLAEDANLDRCLEAMMARKQIIALGIDPVRLAEDLRAGERSYARLFALLHEQVAEAAGKPRWGDQSASIESCADDVLAAYPQATFVHLVRDPRDRLAMEFRREPRRVGDVGRSTGTWLRSTHLAERNRDRHGDAYLVVRYESLVEHPEETVRGVCDALGEGFDPAMLRMPDVARYDEVRAASPEGIGVTAAFVGRYVAELRPDEVAFIERAAAAQMRRLGYRIDDPRPSAGRRLRAAAVRPVNVAAMRRTRGARSAGAASVSAMEVPV